MRRFVPLCVVCALATLFAPPPTAQADITSTVVFEAVDSVQVGDGNLTIEGLVQGETEPRQCTFHFSEDTGQDGCQKHALLMLLKPGRFLLEMTRYFNTYQCKLRRR